MKRLQRIRCPSAAPAAAVLAILLMGAGDAPAALVPDTWTATACAESGGNTGTSCPGPYLGGIFQSETSPGKPGPIALQPATAYQSTGTSATAYQTLGGWNGASNSLDSSVVGLGFAAAAAASMTIEGHNGGHQPEIYTFHFLINGGGLQMAYREFVPLADDQPMAGIFAVFDYRFGPSGTWTPLWYYQAQLVGPNSEQPIIFRDQLFFDVAGLGKPHSTVTRSGPDAAGLRTADVTFAPFVGAIPLPAIAPDGQISIRYKIGSFAFTGDHDPVPNPLADEPFSEVEAWIADPFGLDGGTVPGPFPASGFDIDGVSLESLNAGVVPAPAAGWLAGAALGAVALRARRRRPR